MASHKFGSLSFSSKASRLLRLISTTVASLRAQIETAQGAPSSAGMSASTLPGPKVDKLWSFPAMRLATTNSPAVTRKKQSVTWPSSHSRERAGRDRVWPAPSKAWASGPRKHSGTISAPGALMPSLSGWRSISPRIRADWSSTTAPG